MKFKTDGLFIGFDSSFGTDVACLTVARQKEGKITIINIFYGEEAEAMYLQLIQIHPPKPPSRNKQGL